MRSKSYLPWRWMAPESLRYTTFSTASDVWSFGVTIWEIYTFGEKPYFLQISNEDVCQKIVDGWTLDPPEQCPENIKDIMTQCWKYQPNERYTFEDIVSMIKNSDSDHTQTQTLPISQINENFTKNGYISFGTLIKANTSMRPPDNKTKESNFIPIDSLDDRTIKESLDPNHLLDEKNMTHHKTSSEDNPFIINGVSVGIDTNLGTEPSLKGKFPWTKLPFLAFCILLACSLIGVGIAMALSSHSQGMEQTSSKLQCANLNC